MYRSKEERNGTKRAQKNFFGYCGDKDGYRVWIPSQNKVILSRDVIFRKEQPLEKIVQLSVQQVTNNESSHEGTSVSTDVLQDAVGTDEEESPESVVSKPQEDDETDEDESSEPVVSKRQVKQPEYLKDYVLLAACDVPDSYHSAMSSDDAEIWRCAMDEEIASLAENKMMVLGTDNSEIHEFVEELKAEFRITVGSLECFLGMHIAKLDNGSIFVSQSSYVRKMLHKFNMADVNSVAIPSERSDASDAPPE
ncbi:hypothetical protein JTE90_017318 [Oedothorax gibbosus]|uniref:Gag-pol polyprotein n=1 Tax=Oedothorax gibbosus TaxID=931172 RepID=A0AAV6UCJ2_9ARAC|nr:hypothetical protein JTE90_017318 [Oedothorax gibbosus]